MINSTPWTKFVDSFFNGGSGVPTILGLLKVLFIAGFSMYVVFSIIVLRQVYVMNGTVRTPISGWLIVAAYLNLLISLFVFFLPFVML